MRYLFIIILTTNFLIAQNLDSLFNAIIALRSSDTDFKNSTQIAANTQPEKCGFGIIANVKLHFNEFTTDEQNTIQKILARPERQTSIVSPAGIFRIHYDTTGINAPDYFNGIKNTIQLSVDSLAIAFDSAYNYEVNILKYEPPPPDGIDGGDELYDIYITQLGSGYYGWTDYESIGGGQSKSYIVIDNKMDVPSPGIAGVRVTAAHEFHHAIQVGNYREPLEGDTYYFEITSTSMEEFVYDSINDYYNYLLTYFRYADRRFTYNVGGYDRVIWNIFLKEKFERETGSPAKGFEIIKQSWELMRNQNNSAIMAINLALAENGLSLKNTFAEFSQWVYFTGYRTKNGKYFSEAANYPLVKPFADYEYQAPKKTYMMSVQAMANNFIVFDLSSSGINDTLVSIISNCDVNSAETYPYPSIDYDYSLLTTAEDGSNEIVTGYYSKIASDNLEYIKESNIFNNMLVNGTTISREEIDYAFPQPYNYSKHNYLFFPTKLNESGTAKLAIYSIGMDLIYNDELQIYNNEKVVVRWDGRDNNGNKVPSGIYIYITDSDSKIQTGKIAIINN